MKRSAAASVKESALSVMQIQVRQGLSYEEMEEDLTCPICLELFADPLMMPCSHSVCKTCLHDIMKSRAKGGKQDLECPACREKHHLKAEQVDKLPKNLALENIVFRYQEIRSVSLSKASTLNTSQGSAQTGQLDSSAGSDGEDQDPVFEESTEEGNLCGMCEDSGRKAAEWYCQQCQVLYCQLCLDTYHPKRGSLSRHKIRKPTLRESVECMLNCPDHITESASIFCDTCKVVACHLCVCQGQGLHCNHLILDLETARKQLQATVQGAQGELSTLISSFSDRDTVLESQIQEIKSLEESARSSISSQYNCILSDIAATLNLAKQKSLKNIESIVDQNSSHLAARSQQIKALLAQCQNLGQACESLLSRKKKKEEEVDNSSADVKHIRSSSNLSVQSGGRSNVSFSSVDESFNLDLPLNTDWNKITPGRSSGRVPDTVTKRRSSSHTESEQKAASEDKRTLKDKKVVSVEKEEMLVKKRSSSMSKDHRISSHDEGKLKQDLFMKRFSAGNLTPLPNYKEDLGKEKNPIKCNVDEKFDDFVMTRKSVQDKKNSERKMSGDMEMKGKLSHSEVDGVPLVPVKSENGVRSAVDESMEKSKSETVKPEDQLLVRALEVGPVLEQVALIKENQGPRLSETEESEVSSSVSSDSNQILSCVSDFHISSLALLSNVTDCTTVDHPVITPSVRSVVSPARSSQTGAPRVQSRTLITWGFNSTTFIADPLEESAQWSVSVNRNTSHIGDIKSGYLFGVGVSTKLMSSKEQVGMTPESHAIACIGGQLTVCHDGTHTAIMPLSELPLSVTISASMSKFGLVMAYKILVCGMSQAVCGKRVIALRGEKSVTDDSGEEDLEFKVHPVFTVSQRVKMQFPLSSDV